MGTPKALLPWSDSTLLDYAIEQARSARVTDLVVVLGPATQNLDLPLATATAFNPDPETGRSTSIRLGCVALAETAEAILIQSVDQPVTADILDSLFDAVADGAMVAIPTYAGRRGHPVCLAGSLLGELRAVTEEEQGLRAVVRRHATRVREVSVQSEAVVWNLNDPAAYAAARKRA
jgi:CTP:molybdopterin cytidylyltransferase MocA